MPADRVGLRAGVQEHPRDSGARSPHEAIALLRRLRAIAGHTCWSDEVSAGHEGASPFDRVVGYRQVTDAYLISLTLQRGGRLATFDQTITSFVPGGESVVELIP